MYMFTIKWTMLMKYFSDEKSDKAQKFLTIKVKKKLKGL